MIDAECFVYPFEVAISETNRKIQNMMLADQDSDRGDREGRRHITTGSVDVIFNYYVCMRKLFGRENLINEKVFADWRFEVFVIVEAIGEITRWVAGLSQSTTKAIV